MQYIDKVAGGELLTRGQSYWSGKLHYDEFATPILIQYPYSIQEGFLTFASYGSQYVLRAFITNVANTDVKAGAFNITSVGQDGAIWSTPRTYGVEATYRFY